MKKMFMEFLGTFFFILTIAMTGNPLAIASMLMAWVYIGGTISGAHYNPAVTLGLAIRHRLSWKLVPHYMTAQILGGFAAFAAAFFLNDHISLPAPSANISLLQSFFVEALLAFTLVLVVLAATTERFKVSHIFGFAIGFVIPALAGVGKETSGGLFNPAIALGSYLFGACKGIAIAWPLVGMYVCGSLLGGALAAYVFDFFVGNEK